MCGTHSCSVVGGVQHAEVLHNKVKDVWDTLMQCCGGVQHAEVLHNKVKDAVRRLCAAIFTQGCAVKVCPTTFMVTITLLGAQAALLWAEVFCRSLGRSCRCQAAPSYRPTPTPGTGRYMQLNVVLGSGTKSKYA